MSTFEQDAARYRWLRNHFLEVRAIGRRTRLAIETDDKACIGDKDDAARLDAAFDRAMAEEEKPL